MALHSLFQVLDIDQDELKEYLDLDEYIFRKLADHFGPPPPRGEGNRSQKISSSIEEEKNSFWDPIQQLADSPQTPLKVKGLVHELILYFRKMSVLSPEEQDMITKNPHLIHKFKHDIQLYLAGCHDKKTNVTVLIFLTGVKNHRPTFQIATTIDEKEEYKFVVEEDEGLFYVEDNGAELLIDYRLKSCEDGNQGWVVELFNSASHGATMTPGLGLHPFPLYFDNVYYVIDKKFK